MEGVFGWDVVPVASKAHSARLRLMRDSLEQQDSALATLAVLLQCSCMPRCMCCVGRKQPVIGWCRTRRMPSSASREASLVVHHNMPVQIAQEPAASCTGAPFCMQNTCTGTISPTEFGHALFAVICSPLHCAALFQARACSRRLQQGGGCALMHVSARSRTG